MQLWFSLHKEQYISKVIANQFWLFKEKKTPPFLHLRACCESMVTFMLRRPTSGQESRYPLNMRVVGLQSRSGRFGENKTLFSLSGT